MHIYIYVYIQIYVFRRTSWRKTQSHFLKQICLSSAAFIFQSTYRYNLINQLGCVIVAQAIRVPALVAE